MPSLDDADRSVVREHRTIAADRSSEHRSREDQVQLREALAVVLELRHLRRHKLGQRGKHLLDLLLLLDRKLPQFIVQFYDLHRLDEGCRPRRRLIVDHAGNLVFVLTLVRQTIPPVPLGDQRVLQQSLLRRLRQYGRHALMDLIVGGLYLPTHTPKPRARIVRDLLFREDASVDLPAQLGQRLQQVKPLRERILRRVLPARSRRSVLFHPLRRVQYGSDPQQLRRRQAPSVLESHEALADVADPAEGQTALLINPLRRVLGLHLQQIRLLERRHRHQLAGSDPSQCRAGIMYQHFAYLIKLQYANRSVVHDISFLFAPG